MSTSVDKSIGDQRWERWMKLAKQEHNYAPLYPTLAHKANLASYTTPTLRSLWWVAIAGALETILLVSHCNTESLTFVCGLTVISMAFVVMCVLSVDSIAKHREDIRNDADENGEKNLCDRLLKQDQERLQQLLKANVKFLQSVCPAEEMDAFKQETT